MKYLPVLLTTLFVGLKLTHYIDWSWWWVLIFIWVPAAIGLMGAFLFVLSRILETPEERLARQLRAFGKRLGHR
jgi:hypothetical protein